jgi:1-acyl-sn-glycerol-3-phosphate acyltransferase
MVRRLGVVVEIEGRPPAPPFLLVSNHLGYIDVIVLASLFPATFVARADASRWPFVGRLCRSVGTLFIDRQNRRDLLRASGEIEAALERGRSVVLFPEGTSSGGESVLPFRPSLLEGAAAAGRPVAWVALSYRTPQDAPPARMAVCWWGEMTFWNHLRGMFRLPGFRARLAFSGQPLVDRDRKALARRLREAVLSHVDRNA